MKLRKTENVKIYAGIFALVCMIVLIVYKICGFAPFGNSTLASMDAYIQYVDFFAYLKDVLEGKNSIAYCFGKTLGGNNMAVFSYYLASPFNLLLIFFKKSELHTFFGLMVMIKMGLAAVTCGVWLKNRFSERLENLFVILLSVGYGLSQYMLTQNSNIMWVDGVILLPLMLLGVYRLIRMNTVWYLGIFTGISILVNWYTGAINCLFCCGWWLVELALWWEECVVQEKPFTWIDAAGKAVRYAIAMVCGLLISACLFVPTLLALQGGRASANWELLYNDFIGNILTVLPNFSVGSTNSRGSVSLFCGSLALLGCIGVFLSEKIRGTQKIILGCLMAVILALFYWQPLVLLFSLLKDVSSYWYRYSYGAIAGLIFCAAFYYQSVRQENFWKLMKASAVFGAVVLGLEYGNPLHEQKYIVLLVLILLMLAICVTYLDRKMVSCILCLVILGEAGLNTSMVMQKMRMENVEEFRRYETEQQAMIDEIKREDTAIYRITQLKNRAYSETDRLTATYNEAVAFGYWSLSGYTSDPDEDQRTMLDKFGYRINGENFCVVNTSMLAADSLLGVKYILTDDSIAGTVKVEKFHRYNEKDVYENPYCLPLAFTYKGAEINPEYTGNPFLYLNKLYSEICGKDTELYVPVNYEEKTDGNTIQYSLDVPEENYAVYGNLPWKTEFDGMVNVNGQYQTKYAGWCSPSVFYIPVVDGKETEVSVSAAEVPTIGETQFYALDLDQLKMVTDQLKTGAAQVNEMRNGFVSMQVNAQKGENLFTSIPQDAGWTITINGHKVDASLIAECLLSIPLDEGDNVIQMTYHVPGLMPGIICTIVGAGILLMMAMRERLSRRISAEEKYERKSNQN